MRSMTGFGEAMGGNDRYSMVVSLRAVNHRFLDLQLRIGDEQRGSEPEVRALLAGELERGRIEARLDVRPTSERSAHVEMRMGVIRAAHSAIEQLAAAGLVQGGLAAGDVLRLPEAFQISVDTGGWTPVDNALLVGLVRTALAQLVAARQREGAGLRTVLVERLDAFGTLVSQLDRLRDPVRAELAAALSRRMEELLAGQSVDPLRLAQEAALQADRSDVREELDRLHAHLDHFRVLTEESGAIGKRLDFLTQEIFRELNTLGAKCRNTEMIRAVLDAKVLCEQLREQVQNVE
jgi:uncharacterized protein (TIGR00255 family)